MSGSRDKGYEFIPFISKKKEPRIAVPQRPVVVDQEAAERRRACIRRLYGTRGARDGDIEIVLPTQEEFDRAVYNCEGDGYGNGEEDPDVRSFMEGIVRQALGEEEIEIGHGGKVGPEDSEKKDSTPKNDKEEDGDVVKGEIMKRARLATGDIECSKNGRDGAENSEMSMDDEEGNAKDSDEVKTVVDVKKPSYAAVACKNGDEGVVGNAKGKLQGATSGPRPSQQRPSIVRMEMRGSRKDKKSSWTSKWPRYEDSGT